MTILDWFIMGLLIMGIIIVLVYLWKVIREGCPDE